MADGEVRAFYEALGIELPGWAHTEAPVHCFADPAAHKREDRNPSCSVNLASGAFNCHGCGASGGAYDAALARGRAPKEAIELMVAFGLTHRRQDRRAPSTVSQRPQLPREITRAVPARLTVEIEEVQRWAETLRGSRSLLARLERDRGWSRHVLAELTVGFDGERITVPIWRTPAPARAGGSVRAEPQGVLRLRVHSTQKPKVLALPGTRLGLMPLPAWAHERRALLVEGPSDMLAARSAGLPAIAVPGASAWRSEWAAALTGRSVVVVMDCDRPGRQAARRITDDLQRGGIEVRVADLAPSRDDGYDLSDWLRDGNDPARLLRSSHAQRCSAGPPARPNQIQHAAVSAGRSVACRPS
jgi:hypothetical protein